MPLIEKINQNKIESKQDTLRFESKEEKFYVLGKNFKFENIFLKFYTNKRGSGMLRMVDYDFLSIILENTKVLNIVEFLIHRRHNSSIMQDDP